MAAGIVVTSFLKKKKKGYIIGDLQLIPQNEFLSDPVFALTS
jgi:hypothetical protein